MNRTEVYDAGTRMAATRRTFWLAVLFVAIATLSACHDRTAGPTLTFAHPNGLALTVPEIIGKVPLAVERTPTGFALRDPRSRRYTTQLTVDLRPGVATPPGAWPKKRMVRGVEVRYAVDELDGGGSGDPAYNLRAWEPARGGHIAYSQYVQGEGEDFTIAWAVIEGTKLSP